MRLAVFLTVAMVAVTAYPYMDRLGCVFSMHDLFKGHHLARIRRWDAIRGARYTTSADGISQRQQTDGSGESSPEDIVADGNQANQESSGESSEDVDDGSGDPVLTRKRRSLDANAYDDDIIDDVIWSIFDDDYDDSGSNEQLRRERRSAESSDESSGSEELTSPTSNIIDDNGNIINSVETSDSNLLFLPSRRSKRQWNTNRGDFSRWGRHRGFFDGCRRCSSSRRHSRRRSHRHRGNSDSSSSDEDRHVGTGTYGRRHWEGYHRQLPSWRPPIRQTDIQEPVTLPIIT